MDCPACGEPDQQGRFCVSCGRPLAGGVEREPEDDTAVIDVDGASADLDDEPTDPGPTGEQDTRVVPRVGGGLRECPSCGAPNSPARRLCGRCGADLETGDRPQRAPRERGAPSAPRPGGAVDRLEPSRGLGTGTIVALVVAAGVLLGALVGGLVALETGPFGGGDGEELPDAPDFDAGRYGDEPQPLTVTAIGTSTTHAPLGDVEYDAAKMVDGDLATAWNNDGAQNEDGIGEIIAVEFDGPVWVSRIVVANGSQRDDADFLGNARLRRVRVTLDGEVVYEVVFEDRQGLQAVTLPEPKLSTGLRLDVLSAYPGDTYAELAVSELRMSGWPALGEDREIGRERAGRGEDGSTEGG